MLENTPQPAPITTARSFAVWPLVIAEIERQIAEDAGANPDEAARLQRLANVMRERDAAGRVKYGRPLVTFNGRVALIDAVQEALDLVAYLHQFTFELIESDEGQADAAMQGLVLPAVTFLAAIHAMVIDVYPAITHAVVRDVDTDLDNLPPM